MGDHLFHLLSFCFRFCYLIKIAAPISSLSKVHVRKYGRRRNQYRLLLAANLRRHHWRIESLFDYFDFILHLCLKNLAVSRVLGKLFDFLSQLQGIVYCHCWYFLPSSNTPPIAIKNDTRIYCERFLCSLSRLSNSKIVILRLKTSREKMVERYYSAFM